MYAVFERLQTAELTLCLRINRSCRRGHVAEFFGLISRLGDGVAWYVLIALLPLLYGGRGLATSLLMMAVGLVALLLYRWLKVHTTRSRPRDMDPRILRTTDPLDQFSFPSGHTLHAVAFTTVALSAFPYLGWALIPFALLVASSRVVLGLHYPSDVVAGALVGFMVAQLGIEIAAHFRLFALFLQY